jgi:excinuclease UvrABC nuclease subunit
LISVLEKQMQEAAAELDYETAAQLRDQIFELKAQGDPDMVEKKGMRRFTPRKRRR